MKIHVITRGGYPVAAFVNAKMAEQFTARLNAIRDIEGGQRAVCRTCDFHPTRETWPSIMT